MTSHGLYRRYTATVAAAGLPAGPGDDAPVTEADLAGLPGPARSYLRFMGVVGRPRDWSFQARLTGRFRMRPGTRWLPAEAWQYNSGLVPARIFVMGVRLAAVVSMTGRDTYLGGRGQFVAKVLDRVTVADGHGEEFDISELTTYLDDALLLAPSMLLTPVTTWAAVGDQAFDVTLSDSAHCVTGRVFVDEQGAARDFSTTDRYADLPGGLVRAEWHTPVQSWQTSGGRRIPGSLSAVWQLPGGPMPYIEGTLVPDNVAFNLPPPAR
jgi:hypothetical protein